jgi:hypothetical protein
MRVHRHPARPGRSVPEPLRLVQLLASVALAIGIGGIALTSGAGAQVRAATTTTTTTAATNPNTYNLSAEANALDVLFNDPGAPEAGVLILEAGPYGASASLNSLGGSTSDAGAPYSPSIYSLPGTISGLGSGSLPPLPPFPGYASSDYPGTPTDDESQGGYQLTTSASPDDAKGAANLGVQPSGSGNSTFFASAETTANGDGSVSLSAAAGMDLLSFGQLFDLGNVSSSLAMTQQVNGQPTVTSKTDLGSVTLLGQASGLLGNGVGVQGINTPIELSPENIGTLNTVLSKAGVQLTYLPETFTYTDGTSSTGTSPESGKTLQAVDSGALRVTVGQTVPSQGLTTVTYTLGRVYLSTSDTPGIGPITGNSGAVISTGNTGNTGTGASTTIVSNPSSLAPTGSSGAGAGSIPSSGSTGTAGAPATTPPQSLAEAPVYSLELGPSAWSFYLILVLGALIVLLGSQAVRYFSVRLALSGPRST